MNGLRCFIAVDLPAGMRDEIGRVQKEIATDGLRLVKPEIVHVTMKFLGDVAEEKVDRIVNALEEIKLAPFPAEVRGMGAFPGHSIRVIWLGLNGDFQSLYVAVDKALISFGFRSEERDFNPHATLGRVKHPTKDISKRLAPKIEQFADLNLGRFSVDRFQLKKSTLTRGGPTYDNIAEFSLRAP